MSKKLYDVSVWYYYTIDDRISAVVRISTWQSDVTLEKHFIICLQKRKKLVPMFYQMKNVSDMLWRGKCFVDCSRLRYFVRLCNVAYIKA
jgi:hypothetical protein